MSDLHRRKSKAKGDNFAKRGTQKKKKKPVQQQARPEPDFDAAAGEPRKRADAAPVPIPKWKLYAYACVRAVAIVVVFAALDSLLRKGFGFIGFGRARPQSEMEQIIAQLCPNGVQNCPYGTHSYTQFIFT